MTTFRREAFRVPPEKLRWVCDASCFKFKTTKDAKPLDGVLGQARALKAIELGLHLDAPGYNIYVSGLAGTGKMATIKALLKVANHLKEPPQDILFVHNFKDPQKPLCIKLPAGLGNKFKKDMADFVEDLQRVIPNIFDHQEFKDRRDAIVEEHRDQQKELFRQIEGTIRAENFAMVQVQMGPFTRPMILPLIEGNPVQFEHLENLAANGNFPTETLTRLKEQHSMLRGELESTMKKVRQIERAMREALNELEHSFGFQIVSDLLADLRENYRFDKVHHYLTQVQEAVLADLSRFKERDEQPQSPTPGGEGPGPDEYLEFQVNVIVDNSKTKRRPVIIENTPTYKNLFGVIEKQINKSGNWATDFTKIRAGSILQADGGVLVINLLDAISEAGVWKNLKRALKTRELEIEGWDAFYWMLVSSLKPEPIPINLKIVAIGDVWLFQLLYTYDEDFRKIFKVKADFDHEMEKSGEMIIRYASFLNRIITDEGLLHLSSRAVAAVVEEGVRMTGWQKKLSTRFSIIADIVREADYYARQECKKLIQEDHIDRSLRARRERLSLYEDKLRELVEEGKILITSDGGTVGQVNGLTVTMLGDYAFGHPTRITAQIGLGNTGVINIERESKLSGRIHDKGVQILTGYLRGTYLRDKPMGINASLCFEQSYYGVEGDSASSTEMYALLSELAELPLDQGIAVTGSMNQKGEIQPIGGVNEKIDGFFEICKTRGLNGRQGVIIPVQNVDDLMLSDEIVTAVRKKQFNIWAVKTVDEGISILTGRPAGERGADGTFAPQTVNGLVDTRLRDMANALRKFGKSKADKEEEDEMRCGKTVKSKAKVAPKKAKKPAKKVVKKAKKPAKKKTAKKK
jgi:lon-related putative ATP-dependent protease